MADGFPELALRVRDVDAETQDPLGRKGRRTVVAHLPAPSADLVGASASIEARRSVNLIVGWVIIDVPDNVDYALLLNGSEYLVVDDGQGVSGADPVGDLGSGNGYFVGDAEVQITNNGASAQHVRTRLVGVI